MAQLGRVDCKRNFRAELGVIVEAMKRIGVLAVALLLLAGCTDGDPEPRPDPEPAPEATETEAAPTPAPSEDAIPIDESGRKIPIQLWFLDSGGDGNADDITLRLQHAEIPATLTTGRAALEQLIAGVPDGAPENTFTVVPEDTELLGLTIDKGTARVDFSRDFEDTGMGTTADGLQIPQVVYTLTQFPAVKRVEFLIEGEEVEIIGGHGIKISGRHTRKDFESLLPPIVVFSPYAGQEVGARFTMSGIANVFEATISYRVRDASGKIVDKGFTTATCGTGCYGTFSQVIDVDAEGPVVLEVFESSAEDGRPLNMQRIPLTLQPAS